MLKEKKEKKVKPIGPTAAEKRAARMLSRVTRFQAGQSILSIAQEDHVTFHTVYAYLWAQKVVPKSYLSDEFIAALTLAGLPVPIQEYTFIIQSLSPKRLLFVTPKTNKLRAWRSDFAWPYHKIACEIDGGMFLSGGGSHNKDREKRNAYAILGWRVLYFDTKMLEDPTKCVGIVRAALES